MGLHLTLDSINTDVTLATSSNTQVPSVTAIKAFIAASAGGSITIDANPTDGSANAVSSNGTFDALATKQPINANLTTIAGLSLTDDNILQRKAGVWAARTPAQFKSDLLLSKGDVGLGNVDNVSVTTERAAAATLTNKTMSGASNTFSNIPESAITNLINDLSLLASKASPTLTGIPTAPTAATNTNTTQIATTAFVQAAVPTVNFSTAQYSGTGASGDPLLIANLAGSVITSGTVADARLSPNVPLKNGTNVFSGSNTFGTLNIGDLVITGGILSSNDSPGYALYGQGSGKLRLGGAAELYSSLELFTADAGIFMKSANGTRYKITISNGGVVTAAAAP